jgi:hypothetical protein
MQCTKGFWSRKVLRRSCGAMIVPLFAGKKRDSVCTANKHTTSLRQHYLVQVQRVRLSFSAPLVRKRLFVFWSIVKQNEGLRQGVRTFVACHRWSASSAKQTSGQNVAKGCFPPFPPRAEWQLATVQGMLWRSCGSIWSGCGD